jgi:4-hydroxy-tetrahydrodipicolinate reductase
MNETFKYGLIGSSGRMGKEVISVFSSEKHEVVFEYSLEGHVQKDKPNILIDCSLPEVLKNSINYASEMKIPLIVATTGLSDQQISDLKKLSEKVPVVQSYNYSVGVQVLLRLTEIAKNELPDWDVEITEVHHRFKLDKPSGTAKMLKEIFGNRNINISSLRLGNVPGDHIVSFGGLGEILSISHHATSRRTFAEGILKSAKFALNKENGFYNFKEVVFG